MRSFLVTVSAMVMAVVLAVLGWFSAARFVKGGETWSTINFEEFAVKFTSINQFAVQPMVAIVVGCYVGSLLRKRAARYAVISMIPMLSAFVFIGREWSRVYWLAAVYAALACVSAVVISSWRDRKAVASENERTSNTEAKPGVLSS